MSKNKDKKKAQGAAPKKEEVTKNKVATQQETVENKDTEKVETAAPVENEKGETIVEAPVEEVKTSAETKKIGVVNNSAAASAAVFQNSELQEALSSITLTPETTMDTNHMVQLITVATERFKSKDGREPNVIKVNETLDELTCYCIAVAGINMLANGKKLGLSVPIGAIPGYLRAMGYFGVALPEHQAIPDPENPSQMIIPFEGVSKETEQTVKEEIKMHKNTKPEMDVSLWKSDEDAKKAISYILSDTLSKDNRFQVTLSKTRMYKMLMSADENEKKMWESASIAAIFESMLNVLDSSKSTLLNAVGGQVYSAAAVKQNPILSHLTIKRNFPQCEDKDIAEIVKVIVKQKAKMVTPDKPIEQNVAWIALNTGKREDCLLIPRKESDDDKQIMGRLQSHYGERLGSPVDKNYRIKATNLLATILNLYKTEDFISQYSEADYDDCVKKAQELISGETAPKDDKELEAKKEEVKEEEAKPTGKKDKGKKK